MDVKSQDNERGCEMRKHMLMTLMSVFLIFVSCKRQTLEEPSQITALIPITIDWSESRVVTAETNAVSVFFFPKNGGEPTVHVSNDIYNTEVCLTSGMYSVLIFNETIFESSWTGVSFEGVDKYETFTAIARKNLSGKGNLLYSTVDDNENVIHDPEPLTAWTLDEFEVTPAMITRTRSKTKQGSGLLTDSQTKTVDDALKKLIGVKPQPRTATVTVNLNVANLNNAHILTGALKGLSTKVNLVSGQTSNQPSTHLFTFSNDSFEWNDDKMIHGKAKHSFISFGRMPTTVSTYNFQLNAVKYWGGTPEPWNWNVATHVNDSDGRDIVINIGMDQDHPDMGELKEGVDIGDWNNENIELE